MLCPPPASFNHSILSFIISKITTLTVLLVQLSSQLIIHKSPRLTKRHHLQIREMQLQQLLVLALSASAYANSVASGVSCWKSGPTVSVGNISPSIVTICNYLQGNAYVPQEERSQCVQDSAGVMWNFALTVGEEQRYLHLIELRLLISYHSTLVQQQPDQLLPANARMA